MKRDDTLGIDVLGAKYTVPPRRWPVHVASRGVIVGADTSLEPQKSHFLRNAALGALFGAALGAFFFQPLATYTANWIGGKYPKAGKLLNGNTNAVGTATGTENSAP